MTVFENTFVGLSLVCYALTLIALRKTTSSLLTLAVLVMPMTLGVAVWGMHGLTGQERGIMLLVASSCLLLTCFHYLFAIFAKKHHNAVWIALGSATTFSLFIVMTKILLG